MGISLDDGARPSSTPVVKRTAIGERFVGAIVTTEQRDVTKLVDGVRSPVLKPNGKPRQELVVTCVTMPKSSCVVGIGDDTHAAVEGEVVRLILKGKAFGDWIEQRKAHRGGKLNVGDVVVQTVTYAQQYEANRTPKGGVITDQAAAAAVPRGTTLGFYGALTLHEPKDQQWIDAAEAAYRNATAIAAAPAVDVDEDEPI